MQRVYNRRTHKEHVFTILKNDSQSFCEKSRHEISVYAVVTPTDVKPLSKTQITQFLQNGVGPGKKIHGGSAISPPKCKTEPSKIKTQPLKNRHRLQCKSLLNVADLVNGMWKVAPENKNVFSISCHFFSSFFFLFF